MLFEEKEKRLVMSSAFKQSSLSLSLKNHTLMQRLTAPPLSSNNLLLKKKTHKDYQSANLLYMQNVKTERKKSNSSLRRPAKMGSASAQTD